jgi:pimeloyl-ACP methyl ester carboxylesterase
VGLRGHGHSGKQEHNWAPPQAAPDVRALLEQLDLHDVMLAATTGRSGAALAGFGRRTRSRLPQLMLVLDTESGV